jgi:hypothetical protein
MKYIDACQAQEWTIGTWGKKEGESPSFFPYRCNSWRHEGPCRDRCGALDFARVMTAIESRRHWTYLVFTFPQSTKRLDKEAFTSGCRKWAMMRKRMQREFGDFKYIQTWEIHKTGWPHVNCLVSNESLHRQATENYRKIRRKFFIPANVAIGFGRRIWVEPMKHSRHIAGYLTKLGLELVGAQHKCQIPVNAPPHFRRIRASVGLLPKRIKDESKTGQLFKMDYTYMNDHFDRTIPPMDGLTKITEGDDGIIVANNEGWRK